MSDYKSNDDVMAAVSSLEKKLDTYSRQTVRRDVPWTTTGSVNSSKGFSISKALAARLGFIDEASAKDDLEALRLFSKSLADTQSGYSALQTDQHTIKIPLSTALLPKAATEHEGFRVYKAMEAAGSEGYDPDEARWIFKKSDLSYLTNTLGGYTVPPPIQGEMIDLMRPKEAFLQAGATTVPLPPNGRISYPRLTGTSTAYWVGENTSITQSNQTFGQVNLQAKKLGDYVVMPNELLKYSAVAVDSIIRNEMSKTLALAFDYACFYGAGGATQPKGLISYTGTDQVVDYATLTPAPKGVATDGNRLRPEDGYRMAGLIQDRNFAEEDWKWIMRPSMAHNTVGYRADAVTANDAAGAFVNSMMRLVSDRTSTDLWCGYPIVKSSVVLANYTKGSGTNLTEVFGGIWSNWLLGMYGAVEIAVSNQAGTLFQSDQTGIRVLMHCDAAPRYEGAFVRYKQLLNTVN
jgi:hypothetical protein